MSLFVFVALMDAQTPGASDSASTVQQKRQTDNHSQKVQAPSANKDVQRMKFKGFIDEDGDGIDDRVQRTQAKQHGQMMQDRMHDHFIDLDGDGINDDRCSGMCISQCKTSKEKKGHGMHK
jgi:hypothetical protein